MMIKLLVLDVDGVLTDGGIVYNEKGEETKRFHVRDGLGIKLAQSAGLEVIIISGRPSKVTDLRALELGIEKVYTGVGDKASKILEVAEELGYSMDETAAIGDDLNDMAMLKRCGFSACVPGAPGYVKDAVSYVTVKKGGDGAVREFIELILKRQDQWEDILDCYQS